MDDYKLASAKLKIEFANHNRRILRANKTLNVSKRVKYMSEAILSYNTHITEVIKLFDHLGYEEKTVVRQNFLNFKSLIYKYIGAYNLTNCPEPTDGYHPIEIDSDQLEALVSTGLIPDDNPLSDDEENFTQAESSLTIIMAISKIDYINLCARHMPANYNGNFETLRSFVNKIKFLQEIAGTDESLINTLKSYILTKLDQKALSKVRQNPATVEEIIKSLEDKIVHDSSKVLEGRMVALTLDNKSLIEFQQKAESLADSYQQALVEEGIPLDKAEKMAIEKTVDLCRKNTKATEVKAVLSAAAFTNAPSVIAKMVTQIDALRLDRSGQNNKNDRPRGGNQNRGNRGRRGYSRNGGNGNSSQQGNSGHSGHNNSNNNGNGRENNNSNGRNRRGRGGYGHRGGNNGHSQFYQNEQQVYTVQGNGQTPHQGAHTHAHAHAHQSSQHTQ